MARDWSGSASTPSDWSGVQSTLIATRPEVIVSTSADSPSRVVGNLTLERTPFFTLVTHCRPTYSGGSRGGAGGRVPLTDQCLPPLPPPTSDNCTVKIVELLYLSVGN